MGTISTLFVLGSGSNVPYGLPSGPELKFDIVQEFRSILTDHWGMAAKEKFQRRPEIGHFINRFERSEFTTIDRWIASNPKYRATAKAAIFAILSNKLKNPREVYSKIIPRSPIFNSPNSHIDIGGRPKRGGNWFSVVFSKLTESIYLTPDLKSLLEIPIDIVTFNYEHFFEYHFYYTLINSFTELFELPENRELIEKICQKFSPYHVNGEMEGLQDFKRNGQTIPLYTFNSYEQLVELSSKIFTLGSDEASNIPINLNSYEQIYFLGFGYDQENLHRIGFKGQKINAKIFGTAFGSTSLEIEEIISRLCMLTDRDINTSHDIVIEDKDSYLFLRERLKIKS